MTEAQLAKLEEVLIYKKPVKVITIPPKTQKEGEEEKREINGGEGSKSKEIQSSRGEESLVITRHHHEHRDDKDRRQKDTQLSNRIVQRKDIIQEQDGSRRVI